MLASRVRQHVNPLASHFDYPPALPAAWDEVLADAQGLPLVVDVGCAAGGWMVALAKKRGDVNVIGLEIRRPVAKAAAAATDELANAYAAWGNVLPERAPALIDALPREPALITFHFPDPWFKKKHTKRRVVNPGLARALASRLAPGTGIFVQTDVLELFEAMDEVWSSTPGFERSTALPDLFPGSVFASGASTDGSVNATGVATELETRCLARNMPIYRALFVRSAL